MKANFFKSFSLFVTLSFFMLPAFSQPVLVDASSKVEYAIEWHLNGGIQNKANTDTYTAEDGLVLAAPTREGYVFNGWYSEADLSGDKITAIQKGETQKKVFYAGWVITKEQAVKIMQDEMVTVIPAGKKVNLEDFAGTNGTQVINAYQIAKHEVTQELYMSVMQSNPSYFKNNPADGEVQEKRPVENVSWYDAVYFCNKLSILMGLTPAYSIDGQTDPEKWGYIPHEGNEIYSEVKCDYSANGFRLPTEAELEMAARGGVAGGWNLTYAGSDYLSDVAWYDNNSYNRNSNGNSSHEVGKKKPNALGLYDMSGNVEEWCDTKFTSSSTDRVCRGGSYYDSYSGCTVSYRNSRHEPYAISSKIGFRVVRSIQ